MFLKNIDIIKNNIIIIYYNFFIEFYGFLISFTLTIYYMIYYIFDIH